MRSVYWLMFAAWVGCGTEKEDGASGGDTAIDGDTDNASDVDTDTAADADPESDCTDFEMNLLEAETLLPAVVRVFFRLTNCDGEAVPGLTEADFTVLEDGDSISIFESSQQIVPTVAGYQLSTLLLLDMSGSMVAAGLVDDLQAATRTFIDRMGTEHEIAIYTFDGREVLSLLVDFTQDATVLNDGIASDRTARSMCGSRYAVSASQQSEAQVLAFASCGRVLDLSLQRVHSGRYRAAEGRLDRAHIDGRCSPALPRQDMAEPQGPELGREPGLWLPIGPSVDPSKHRWIQVWGR